MKVIKDYGIVADHGSKVLKLQVVKDSGNAVLALVSYKDGMSVGSVMLAKEDAKDMYTYLSEYLDYKPKAEAKADPIEPTGIVHSLCQLPSGDCNYATSLRDATNEEINEAIQFMEESGGRHQTRIKTCKAELKRRESETEGQRLIREYEAKQKSKANVKANAKIEVKTDEELKEYKVKIVDFPTDDKKPEVIKLKTTGNHTYEECEAKIKKETEGLSDSDNKYVIDGLLELCKVDADFRNNFMRDDKSYLGFMGYMFEAALNGYCFQAETNKGKGGILDRDRALGLAINYYNNDEEKQKAIEEEKRKKEAEERKAKAKTQSKTKAKPKKTYTRKETVGSALQTKGANNGKKVGRKKRRTTA